VKNEYRNISFARKVLLRKNEIKNRNNFVSSGYLNDSQRLKSYKDYFFKKKKSSIFYKLNREILLLNF